MRASSPPVLSECSNTVKHLYFKDTKIIHEGNDVVRVAIILFSIMVVMFFVASRHDGEHETMKMRDTWYDCSNPFDSS